MWVSQLGHSTAAWGARQPRGAVHVRAPSSVQGMDKDPIYESLLRAGAAAGEFMWDGGRGEK